MCDCDERIAKLAWERDELKRQNRELQERVRILKEQNERLADQKRDLLNKIVNDSLKRDRTERQRERANAGYLEVTERRCVWKR